MSLRVLFVLDILVVVSVNAQRFDLVEITENAILFSLQHTERNRVCVMSLQEACLARESTCHVLQ